MRPFTLTPTAGAARQRVWDRAQRRRGQSSPWSSQSGQDRWLDEEVFDGRDGGVFVDVGGFDGVTGSNTLFFEQHRAWAGLLVEPVPEVCDAAARVRRCPCVAVAAGAADGVAPLRVIRAGAVQTTALVDVFDQRILDVARSLPDHDEEVIEVPLRTLAGLLAERGMDRLDYVSLDVEGAEIDVLAGFPLDRIRVTAWTIENLSGTDDVRDLLADHGYDLVHRLGMDDVYVDRGAVSSR